MTTAIDIALSADQLATLDDFLLGEDDVLGIDEAHGYITAVLVGNTAYDETQLLNAILGDVQPPDEVAQLLLTIRDEISAALKSAKAFEPLVIEEEENGETFEAYEGWCYGFMLAISDNESHWAQLPGEQKDLLAPIATLALLRDEDLDMDDEEYSGWVGLLPGSVSGLYNYWR